MGFIEEKNHGFPRWCLSGINNCLASLRFSFLVLWRSTRLESFGRTSGRNEWTLSNGNRKGTAPNDSTSSVSNAQSGKLRRPGVRITKTTFRLNKCAKRYMKRCVKRCMNRCMDFVPKCMNKCMNSAWIFFPRLPYSNRPQTVENSRERIHALFMHLFMHWGKKQSCTYSCTLSCTREKVQIREFMHIFIQRSSFQIRKP